MEAFFRTHAYLVEHTNVSVRRTLMDEINWNGRMIGIKGTRGVGSLAHTIGDASMSIWTTFISKVKVLQNSPGTLSTTEEKYYW